MHTEPNVHYGLSIATIVHIEPNMAHFAKFGDSAHCTNNWHIFGHHLCAIFGFPTYLLGNVKCINSITVKEITDFRNGIFTSYGSVPAPMLGRKIHRCFPIMEIGVLTFLEWGLFTSTINFLIGYISFSNIPNPSCVY